MRWRVSRAPLRGAGRAGKRRDRHAGHKADATGAPPPGRKRQAVVALAILLLGAAIGAQMLRLALGSRGEVRLAAAEPIGRTFARPDIVDRRGHLIATDVGAPSLYADPALILDLDEVVDKLAAALGDIDPAELRRTLEDRTRRFVWIRRGLAPLQAQRLHDLGLPGLAFRREPKRVYPAGALTGHVVGYVNIDNKGVVGLERYIDETIGVEPVQGAGHSRLAALRLSIDLGVQHALSEELKGALERYHGTAAAGLVMDAGNGEVIAALSLPEPDSNRPADFLESRKLDRIAAGTYELGSIFKAFTIAMALEDGGTDLERFYDVTEPLRIGPHTIRDLHPERRPITVREIFLHSSNVGAGLIARDGGRDRQRAFLGRLGLLDPMRAETGPIAAPQLPQRWGEIETVTIAYGHGLAVAPLQIAAAAAALINGGYSVRPTFFAEAAGRPAPERILAKSTSDRMRELFRLNVTAPRGTGRRADAPGYRVGGKTGTAELPDRGGYRSDAVISSFLGAMPMDRPRYVILISLFEPQGTEETRGQVTAGLNAAEVTSRLVTRIAPILGLLPRRLDGTEPAAAFDVGGGGQ